MFRNVGMDQLNEPLSEQEIRRVFSKVGNILFLYSSNVSNPHSKDNFRSKNATLIFLVWDRF